MPRNNSPERREHRRRVAEDTRNRRIEERSELQRVTDMQLLNAAIAVLAAAAEIVDGFEDDDIVERETQQMHHCGRPERCTLAPAACSALNQNMPPHMIMGQQF